MKYSLETGQCIEQSGLSRPRGTQNGRQSSGLEDTTRLVQNGAGTFGRSSQAVVGLAEVQLQGLLLCGQSIRLSCRRVISHCL